LLASPNGATPWIRSHKGRRRDAIRGGPNRTGPRAHGRIRDEDSPRPPRGSRRALLTHRAPPSVLASKRDREAGAAS
jgi:hypothetical protein